MYDEKKLKSPKARIRSRASGVDRIPPLVDFHGDQDCRCARRRRSTPSAQRRVLTSGLATSTWHPRSTASQAISKCVSSGVKTVTTSPGTRCCQRPTIRVGIVVHVIGRITRESHVQVAIAIADDVLQMLANSGELRSAGPGHVQVGRPSPAPQIEQRQGHHAGPLVRCGRGPVNVARRVLAGTHHQNVDASHGKPPSGSLRPAAADRSHRIGDRSRRRRGESARERTRTSTPLRAYGPQPYASASSATRALIRPPAGTRTVQSKAFRGPVKVRPSGLHGTFARERQTPAEPSEPR